MLVDPGHHLGDAWFAVDGPTAHCWYLRCPDRVPRHTDWEIAHATSDDLREWVLHGTSIARGREGEWDGRCLATGSVMAVDGGWWMAYTAGWADADPAIGIAVSTDGQRWRAHPDNPVAPVAPAHLVDRPFDGRPRVHWRDPFLTTGPSGRPRMLVCAARSDCPADTSGTVAVLDMDPAGRWRPAGPLAAQGVARELECPQVHRVGDAWFLVFSTWPHLFGHDLQRQAGDRLRAGTYAMEGPGPEGPFELRRPEPIVPADHPVQPYAGQLVAVGGEHLLLGTVWSDDGPDSISDPIRVVQSEGGLVAVT